MHDWYYSVDRQPPTGPVAEADLRRLLAGHELPAATLVWHEGMAQWQRADHPGLDLTAPLAGPPSLPPSLPPSPPPVHTPPTATRPSPAPGPGRGAALLVVGTCAVLLLVVVLAILAAIALPAYQNYVQISRASAVLTTVRPLQHGIESAVTGGGQCPDNSSAALLQPLAQARAATHIASVDLVSAVNGHCGIAVQLQGLHRDREKRPAMLWLEHNGGGDWICRSTLRDNQLPRHCRTASNIDKS